jgi:hypothetical protein
MTEQNSGCRGADLFDRRFQAARCSPFRPAFLDGLMPFGIGRTWPRQILRTRTTLGPGLPRLQFVGDIDRLVRKQRRSLQYDFRIAVEPEHRGVLSVL